MIIFDLAFLLRDAARAVCSLHNALRFVIHFEGGCITLPDTGHSLTKPHCKTILQAFQPNVTPACIRDSSLTRPHDFKTEKAKFKSSHQKSPISALAVTQKRRITRLIIEQSGNVGTGGWGPASRAED
ncbi:hypothetical protein P5673_004290 [Acropora cervicornis]|uniref:Uncharacterized protein n=1 Tax=Acropora cervicornis TaxID=6130 RepID=A0AAD9QZZ4_ACRCE|nr:hypothetical protein P5673_004290 [Acropora cervicornis]